VRDKDTVIRTPHDATVTRVEGKKHVEVHDPRTSVTIKEHGCELVLFFADFGRQGPVREIRILPDTKELKPATLRQFLPNAPRYVQYARSVFTSKADSWRSSALALRKLGATKRGLGEDFYRIVAESYAALIAEGEPHPVKALAQLHHVGISTASRWIKEARRQGLIKDEGSGG